MTAEILDPAAEDFFVDHDRIAKDAAMLRLATQEHLAIEAVA